MAELGGEWDGQQDMQPGFLPRHWRDRRLLYRLGLQAPGWWVDVEHPDSIAAISGGIGKQLRDGAGLERLTLGVLHGENRTATTLIATRLRSLTLDDKTEPVGIRFRSKHSGGYSWAYWLRRADTGLTGDPMTADDGKTIESNRPSLLAVTSRCHFSSIMTQMARGSGGYVILDENSWQGRRIHMTQTAAVHTVAPRRWGPRFQWLSSVGPVFTNYLPGRSHPAVSAGVVPR